MIKCQCGTSLIDMSDVRNVKQLGFALFGDCYKCGTRQAVEGIWRRKKVEKYVPIPLTYKKREKLVVNP
jgi:hypothetical protein